MYGHRSKLEARNFGFKNKSDCFICVAKMKALMSCVVTAQLICAFVFAKAEIRFSHVGIMLSFTEELEAAKTDSQQYLDKITALEGKFRVFI